MLNWRFLFTFRKAGYGCSINKREQILVNMGKLEDKPPPKPLPNTKFMAHENTKIIQNIFGCRYHTQ